MYRQDLLRQLTEFAGFTYTPCKDFRCTAQLCFGKRLHLRYFGGNCRRSAPRGQNFNGTQLSPFGL